MADDKELEEAVVRQAMSLLSQRRWRVATEAERKRQGAAMQAGRRKARRHRQAKAREAAKNSPR